MLPCFLYWPFPYRVPQVNSLIHQIRDPSISNEIYFCKTVRYLLPINFNTITSLITKPLLILSGYYY